MADTATEPPKRRSSSSPAKTTYLVLYNFVSAVAWLTVLGRTLAIYNLRGSRFVYLAVGEWTKWTQTMAALEILHALLGLVRSPVSTTIMQVSSRFLLVWLVVDPFPWLARSPAYTTMLLAWSVTEVIRYSYFALNLGGLQPRALVWLRYNTFFVLYPIGIMSECAMIWSAVEPASEENPLFAWALYAILAIYVPGSYILYTYMMAQRRKVLRSLKAQDEKATQ